MINAIQLHSTLLSRAIELWTKLTRWRWPHDGPGLVQLWEFGKLTHHGAMATPHICMGFAHNYGCVWDLKWCPSGCWQDPMSRSDDEVASGQRSEVRGDARLGVLGMACSDGTVRVICVPHPKIDAVNKAPMYKLKPVLSLYPCYQHGQDSAPWFGQCWCLEWLPRDKHTQILASFSNGTVALWNLCTTSSLLQMSNTTDGKILYPTQVFSLCDAVIRSFAWCPLDPNYIATVCTDKRVQFWDLRDTGYPIMTYMVNLYIECKWLSHWPGCFASVDNSHCPHRYYSLVAYHECGYFGYSYFPTTMHQSCVWGADVSDWLNSVVSVDAGGDAELMVLPALCHDTDNGKAYSFQIRRRSLYFTDLEKISPVDNKKLNIERCGGGNEPNEIEMEITSAEDPEVMNRESCTNQGEKDAIESGESRIDPHCENENINRDKRTDGNLVPPDGQMEDVAIEVEDVSGSVEMETAKEELHDGNTQGNMQSGQDDSVPMVIKTEPIDPDECTNASMSSDIALDTSSISAMETDVSSSNVSQSDRTMGGNIAEETSGVEFQDEIAQLLQVCQEVQDSLTEPATPADDTRTGNSAPVDQVGISSVTNTPGTRTQSTPDNEPVESAGKVSGKEIMDKNMELGEGQSKQEKKRRSPLPFPRSYSEMEDDYGLVYNDMDMSEYANTHELGWKNRSLPRLRYAEGMKEPPPDQFPLQALYKICCNPNYGSHCWVLTAGQAGIVRAHCMTGLDMKPKEV
ncbi:uncharacterized protein [Amphiura filiformis]|uniref:uncharacterized protein isoform X2 n=1 Tax=Amphiura filiformis TaxID=82378 RepID=UPI003B225C86